MALKNWSVDLARRSLDFQEAQLRKLAQRWRNIVRAVFLVMAAVVWLTFIEETVHGHRLTLEAVADRDANLATAVEHYSVRVLRTARAVHGLLEGMVVQRRSEQELVHMMADRARANDSIEELGLCLADGRVLPPPAAGSLLDEGSCAQVLPLTRTGAEISVLPPAGEGGARRLPVTLQLRDPAGQFLGVAVALVRVETLLGVMQSAQLHDDTAVLLLGADGLARAAWRSRTGHVTDATGLKLLSGLIAARGDTASIEGRDYLVTSHPVPSMQLHIVVASAAGDALADYRDRRLRMLLLCALMTAGLGGAYWLLAHMHAEGVERANALNNARAELQALNISLDQQVQERTSQLQQAYRDLETFSYAVAHDVRAPLAGISGFAEALQPFVEDAGTDKHQHYLKRIKANAAHMDELTRGLLELGRLSRAPLQQRPVDLTALAHDVVARLRETGADRDVDVRIEPGLSAQGDGALLRQVLENLLGNAWKFSSRRPLARIAFGREQDSGAQAVFSVEDNGEGFDNDRAANLFQPFSRLHKSSEFPGTGVGLAAVRRIVALHGGDVWCQAQPGAGARFFFSLPASRA
ncbi:sensor histidine kinase [Ramlibacter sp. Leaf400]|uniref:sensor histidine kinase n=1 Tax=Ramlibacter sp. Leaf400 TaxID=1736365 RepID=UPI0007153C01|nr:sensor histidine kinase [Ramlibacter sp. Leaf400]KQT13561.1 hypothetical protein ASG30_19260 [Ramlibacter sp. Leaf400]